MTRRITVDRLTHDIAIHDVLGGAQPNGACFRGSLHFAPDLELQVDPAAATIVAADPDSSTKLTAAFASEHLAGFRRFSSQKDPLRGWGTVPDGFGPVQTVVYDVCGSGPVDISLNWSGGNGTSSSLNLCGTNGMPGFTNGRTGAYVCAGKPFVSGEAKP